MEIRTNRSGFRWVSTGRRWKSEPRETPGRISQSQRVENKVHGMGCQNGPKNLQGPPNPPCFYFLSANNDDRRTAVLFCRSARPRTPFFGGTIDEKKRMRCHGMGCQNGPKNLQGPQFPNPKNGNGRTFVLFCQSARPRTPFFLGGTINDKKGMLGHGMGCQNWPKNEQRPPIP